MMAKKDALITVEQAKEIVALLEAGDQDGAESLLADICVPNASQLFDKVGQLTRQLHDSLQEFKLDPRLPDLASQDIPDARERLNYVIEMTDKAANRTMDAVDASLPLAEKLNDSIVKVKPSWRALMGRDLSVGQFKELCYQLDEFIESSEADASQLKELLTEILMAQDFQDLTGQTIRKVITLVGEVEDKLVEMLTVFGHTITEDEKAEKQAQSSGIEAEGPIIDKSREDVVSGQDDVDDLLSSLGF
ncbi:protein phosphatase CheZ [Dongshaea marina]|uniref:protein phosphatase CheZ n=1 Tax=Dongshaea marina TaxID=2047966 RepID=UPI000D3E850F|nr:protein phosphatase CheZ [Dongshaea marina]